MAIANSVHQHLRDTGVEYDSIQHRPTSSSLESARVSFVAGDKLAKGVVFRNKQGYLLGVLPSSKMADLNKVGTLLNQPVSLALEVEIRALFPDCDEGAIPPVGAAYGLHTIVDESLDEEPDVYFEAGDHRTLIHLTGSQFLKLMQKSSHANICSESSAGHDGLITGYYGA